MLIGTLASSRPAHVSCAPATNAVAGKLSSHMHSAHVTCQTAHPLLVLPHCGAPLPTGPCRRWFMQLLLPVNVYALVHEKEHHLRMMMRMQVGEGRMQGWLAGVPAPALLPAALQQPRKSLRESCSWPWLHLSTHGEEREPSPSIHFPAQPNLPHVPRWVQGLREEAYYLVQYVWMVALYCLFMFIFVLFGSLLGLKLFLLNSYSVQVRRGAAQRGVECTRCSRDATAVVPGWLVPVAGCTKAVHCKGPWVLTIY